jgi:hypothetical protein
VPTRILSALVLAYLPAFASPIGYALKSSANLATQLIIVDLAGNAMTLVGDVGCGVPPRPALAAAATCSFPFIGAGGLAISPTGVLYAADFNGSFFSIDISTAVPTFIRGTLGQVGGLDFLDDTLLGTDQNTGLPARIFSIDTATGSRTTIAQLPNTSIGRIRAFTVKDATTVLVSAGGGGQLYSVKLGSGIPTLIGPFGSSTIIVDALDFADNGNLYGFDSRGREFLIDQLTGSATPIGSSIVGDAKIDLAITAVPEATTAALVVMGMVLIFRPLRERRSYNRPMTDAADSFEMKKRHPSLRDPSVND